jgi:hypothetical protein
VSEFAAEPSVDWPPEADAVDDELDWSPEADAVDDAYGPDSPAFREAARAYGMQHAEQLVAQLVDQHVAPLTTELDAVLEQQRLDEAHGVAIERLGELGVEEDDHHAVLGAVSDTVGNVANQLGVDPLTCLRLIEQAAGIGDGSGDAAALMMLELASEAWKTSAPVEGDEHAVLRKYFPNGGQGLFESEPVPFGGQTPVEGDEHAVFEKWRREGRFQR